MAKSGIDKDDLLAVRLREQGQKQHVQPYRKLLFRKRLLRWAVDGAAYVPFIGEGDIAVDLYTNRKIYGADIDPDMVKTAVGRLPGAQIKVADCDMWPFPGLKDTIAVADFDAYAEPYRSFRSFWRLHEQKADRVVMFFTDGRRSGFIRTGTWVKPDGTKVKLPQGAQRVAIFNSYLTKHVWPWFESHIEPWRVIDRFRYQREFMVYWGAVVERPKKPRSKK